MDDKPDKPAPVTRRKFATCAAAAAAGWVLTACGPRRLHDVSTDRLKQLIGDLEREYAAKYGKQVTVSDAGPLPGVVFGYALDISRCIGCRRCVYACAAENNQSRDPQVHWIRVLQMDKDHGVDFTHADAYYQPDEVPQEGHFYVPVSCQQCQNAPCANVCPVGATFHTPEGVVLIDQERCIGCRLCMAACPYDRRFFNWGEPEQPDWVKESAYNVETQIPAMRGTVMKCDFCPDRTSVGGLPMCVEGCPRGAMWFGDLEEDVATNGTDVARLSLLIEETHAEPYKAELGTEPRVYYIPGHGEDVGESNVEGPRFMKDRIEWMGSRTGTENREPVEASGGHGHG